MILHLVNDEKFVDMGFREFENAFPGQNRCFVLPDIDAINYIKRTPYRRIKNFSEISSTEFIDTLRTFDLIVMHGLDRFQIEVLKYAPEGIPIVWIGYGYDYYDLISNKVDLMSPWTKKLFFDQRKMRVQKMNIPTLATKLFSRVEHWLKWGKNKEDLLTRIDYFAPVLSEEYAIVKNAIGKKFKAEFIDWNYGTLEDDLIGSFAKSRVAGNSILVGNNSYYINNHADIFKLLSHLDIEDRQVVVPLAYGDIVYRDVIIKVGKETFGKNFYPLSNFVSIEEYIKIISSCSVAIMPHLRQQALGNIITMMHLGATIFLHECNPVLSFFKSKGAHIFSIEALEKDHALIDFRLSEMQIEQNRKILEKYWSREESARKTMALVTLAMNGDNPRSA
jgi:dTDP-N-acetylfucosamine:lipid II N-acetylfucosaminyltransferase